MKNVYFYLAIIVCLFFVIYFSTIALQSVMLSFSSSVKIENLSRVFWFSSGTAVFSLFVMIFLCIKKIKRK